MKPQEKNCISIPVATETAVRSTITTRVDYYADRAESVEQKLNTLIDTVATLVEVLPLTKAQIEQILPGWEVVE